MQIPIGRAPVRPQIGVTMEFNCDKISVEMDGQVGIGQQGIARLSAGGFVEASKRGGDVTVFAGPKFTGNVGATTGSARAGVAMTMDDFGLKSVALKADAAQRVGGGNAGMKLQTFDSDLVIWTAAPRPPTHDPKYGLALWPTVQ
jgi:hypothetical protein